MTDSTAARNDGPGAGLRRLESLALLATIPAFHLAPMSRQRKLGTLVYLAAFAASAAVTWTEALARPAIRDAASPSRLGPLLGAALLASALLAQGDRADLLILRLGTATLVLLRWSESNLPLSWRGELPQLLGSGIGVPGLCGLGFWWLEPNAPTFGDGLWLAFTTAATVGYGDIVPSTPGAKIFAVSVVLMGLAVLSLVTASIAALCVQKEERRIEQDLLRELHQESRSIRTELFHLRRDGLAAPTFPAEPPCTND